jgi:hypothetical protein
VSYVSITEDYGRKIIDLPRFAADVARELGVTVQPPEQYPNEQQYLLIGTDKLSLRAINHKKRVSVYIDAPDVPYGDWSTYDKAQRTESITVNPDGRSISAIAKDIKKRAVDANLPALAARRAYAAQQKQNRANIVDRAAKLKAACPKLDIRVNEANQNASIYSGPSAFYLSGNMGSDGRVSIDRFGAVSTETFLKIVAVLEASGEKA